MFRIIALLLFAGTSCNQNNTNAISLHETDTTNLQNHSKAVFAAGCFWHEEALFDGMKGVVEAVSGYAGGHLKDPTYEQVLTGETGHAESVIVYYDSSIVTYPVLLKAYFEAQDPTQVNGQGPDIGTQYRSIAFYNNEKERLMIENYIDSLNASGRYDKPIAVEPMQFDHFWTAEDYHQEYVKKNPNSRYVQQVCIKEVKKVRKEFPELFKEDKSWD